MSTEVDPRIPEKLFFRIGEVCDLINVQPHVLRYWESEFPMLAPQKNRAGQRVYRRKDVEMVFRIRDLLYEQKFTIAGAKKRLLDDLRRGGPQPRQSPARSHEPPQPDIRSLDEAPEPQPPETIVVTPQTAAAAHHTVLSPKSLKVLKQIKRDLGDLLTLLKSDASIRR
ncbi:MAG TPA: MerR family transcriptional regulator [Blastocatellia bacterium]|nr:MerR family transcriptional regulator [Blastocatellia bacterium]